MNESLLLGVEELGLREELAIPPIAEIVWMGWALERLHVVVKHQGETRASRLPTTGDAIFPSTRDDEFFSLRGLYQVRQAESPVLWAVAPSPQALHQFLTRIDAPFGKFLKRRLDWDFRHREG